VGTDGRLLYLKDWHYTAECPDKPAYALPTFFSEDWLNAFYCRGGSCGDYGAADIAAADAAAVEPTEESPKTAAAAAEAAAAGATPPLLNCTCSTTPTPSPSSSASPPPPATPGAPSAATADYRFIYIGPAGSWTALHADVLRSFSWSANVAGTKRWRLLPPAHSPLIAHALRREELAPDFFFEDLCAGAGVGVGGGSSTGGAGSSDLGGDDLKMSDYPGLAAAQKLLFEVIQGPGDALFVPSGW